MAKKKAAANSVVGKKGRVKPGISSPEFPDISIAGWSGEILEVSGQPPAENYLIEWDSSTVSSMPPEYVQRCEAQQLFHLMSFLPSDSVEVAG